MTLVEGTMIAGRFRLIRQLGRGGMGEVWLAQHLGLDTSCAIKFIHPEVAELTDVRARFEREAKAAAQLRSSHVVQILDYGLAQAGADSAPQPYIAMEYLDGEDLAARLDRQGRLSPTETLAVVTQVARALTKAHGVGLVHRDLKPENIFIVREDDHDIIKVLDFGIAKNSAVGLSDSGTKTGSLLGTPYYMSPEQAQGTKAVDYRSDLWALSVLTYRCVTGSLPFTSEALGDLLLKIIVNPLPVPTAEAEGVPLGFDAWWAKAAERDPARRFQSAKELADSLVAALGTSSQPAHELSTPPDVRPISPHLKQEAPPVQTPFGVAGTLRPARTEDAEEADSPTLRRPRNRVGLVAAGIVVALGVFAVFAFSRGGTVGVESAAAPAAALAPVEASSEPLAAKVPAPEPPATAEAPAKSTSPSPKAGAAASASSGPHASNARGLASPSQKATAVSLKAPEAKASTSAVPSVKGPPPAKDGLGF